MIIINLDGSLEEVSFPTPIRKKVKFVMINHEERSAATHSYFNTWFGKNIVLNCEDLRLVSVGAYDAFKAEYIEPDESKPYSAALMTVDQGLERLYSYKAEMEEDEAKTPDIFEEFKFKDSVLFFVDLMDISRR